MSDEESKSPLNIPFGKYFFTIFFFSFFFSSLRLYWYDGWNSFLHNLVHGSKVSPCYFLLIHTVTGGLCEDQSLLENSDLSNLVNFV